MLLLVCTFPSHNETEAAIMNQRLPVNAIKTETTDWTCKAQVVGKFWTREKKLRGNKSVHLLFAIVLYFPFS